MAPPLSLPIILTDNTGNVVEETEYRPYGGILSGGTESKHLYTGQEYDHSTGLNYYKSRYYQPHIQRFIQPDTIIPDAYDPQQLNPYVYVRNNPVKYVDPSGHFLFETLAAFTIGWAIGKTYAHFKHAEPISSNPKNFYSEKSCNTEPNRELTNSNQSFNTTLFGDNSLDRNSSVLKDPSSTTGQKVKAASSIAVDTAGNAAIMYGSVLSAVDAAVNVSRFASGVFNSTNGTSNTKLQESSAYGREVHETAAKQKIFGSGNYEQNIGGKKPDFYSISGDKGTIIDIKPMDSSISKFNRQVNQYQDILQSQYPEVKVWEKIMATYDRNN